MITGNVIDITIQGFVFIAFVSGAIIETSDI